MVLENWTLCQDFINQNRSRFKRLCYEYDTKTPVTIKQLIEKSNAYSITAKFKQRIIHESFNSRHSKKDEGTFGRCTNGHERS
jgi:hypothetical protein